MKCKSLFFVLSLLSLAILLDGSMVVAGGPREKSDDVVRIKVTMFYAPQKDLERLKVSLFDLEKNETEYKKLLTIFEKESSRVSPVERLASVFIQTVSKTEVDYKSKECVPTTEILIPATGNKITCFSDFEEAGVEIKMVPKWEGDKFRVESEITYERFTEEQKTEGIPPKKLTFTLKNTIITLNNELSMFCGSFKTGTDINYLIVFLKLKKQ